jgi:ribosomal protein S18 acetylase RimI-like enzyme
MTIRLAQMEELEALHAIVKDATKQMDEQGIPQWDDVYPDKETVTQDIERREMYVIEQNGRAAGIIVINEEQPPEYAAVPWMYAGRALVVHRLTIAPAHQRSGLATRLMDLAEATAVAQRYDCVRLDAFMQNPAAVSLYEKRGYRKAGIVHLRKGEFYCYEKAIKAQTAKPEPRAAGDGGSCP